MPRHLKFWCGSMSDKDQAVSNDIGPKLAFALIANSNELAGAYERLPEDAEILYQQLVSELHREIVGLSSATGQQEAKRHKDNIAHIKSGLDSLDAVSKINLYRTTVKVLKEVAMIAFKIALTTV